MSRDKDVDPVGACVGMKGMRVQSIIRELRGEKIDIIEFSEEITTFAEKALQPAKVSRVSIVDLNDKQIEVIVDDTQLSLAIGKKGQNVRLAAKLLGWKIDIKSEEEKRQEVEQQMQAMGGGPTTPVEQITELGETILEKLIAAGITTVEELADMTPEQLEEIPGIGEKTLEKISVAVRHYFGQYEEGEERPIVAAATALHPTVETAEEPAGDGDSAAVTEGEGSMAKTPEEILAADAGAVGEVEEVRDLSAEDIADAEETDSASDAFSDADVREEQIELDNDAVDSLVNESQEISDEGIDTDGHDRG
jgi:N utilization substance protein A